MNHRRIAVFPGTFDPITLGHYDVIIKSLNLFDKIVIAIGNNSEKNNMFSVKKRKEWIQKTFLDFSGIEIDLFKGLTISFCKRKKAKFLLRGIRNQLDFEFEKNLYYANKKLYDCIETVFILSSYERSYISSCLVREIIKNGGNYTIFVPNSVRI
ncbi:MAG: pantetheine-phosphate adenylyltransferase [Flavobacteriales bacterium]|jgi:pantetheine-phosphate adenylyltransferase|uniref:pantetheine-phosphate adenylyltransferase n=1 Tax=Blattabacterium sp. (Mastotermes darwiniensis) TaxID=39768 RepID=UPI000231DE43|nr:pantetheine-phosphate adenylyltransferase [Blattabacterium sp. (Mastotermes darwiniensis)]AER40631.1 phosphopantetheine adenylyltransferase [Blattabacterium sp. (Mastotermes darwiniensis) str. MADAR]MDR1804728.1 pantetheine-phosphate adenylyltransferase [Flavobacteriales bacterium]